MGRTPGTLMPDRFQETDRGESEIMEIQMGPSHPASHGTIKFNLQLDGETIVDVDVEIGYLHRGFEKMCEQGTWNHCVPVRRPPELRLAHAEQRRLRARGREAARHQRARARQYIRVIGGEISRITDHLTCLGMAVQELGAISAGFYMIEAREFLYDIVEAITGARLTVTYCRLGGVMNDLPADMRDRIARCVREPARRPGRLRQAAVPQSHLRRPHGGRRRASARRTRSRGASPGRCCAPRASPTTCARRSPYLVYDRFDFEVPIGTARRQLRSLPGALRRDRAEHAHHRAGAGADSRRARSWSTTRASCCRPKEEVYGSIEGLMNHFKLVIEGVEDPAGRGVRRPPRAATASSASTW